MIVIGTNEPFAVPPTDTAPVDPDASTVARPIFPARLPIVRSSVPVTVMEVTSAAFRVVIVEAAIVEETVRASSSLTVTVPLVAPAPKRRSASSAVSVFRSRVIVPVLFPTRAELRTTVATEAGASVKPALPVAAIVTLASVFSEILSAS